MISNHIIAFLMILYQPFAFVSSQFDVSTLNPHIKNIIIATTDVSDNIQFITLIAICNASSLAPGSSVRTTPIHSTHLCVQNHSSSCA
jgi:hypothetical protein